MRIRRMYVNGFGIHRDRSFNLEVDAQAVIFFGHNEAGKSTLMGFVRSILFGFPKRNNKLERYEPLSGGLHGGAITVDDGSGTQIRIERYENNGSLKLVYPDRIQTGELALQSLIGGLTADLFRNLFAFSLSELQQIDSLQAEEISSFLFNAGMGISGSLMAQAERKLTQQMELLYKPGGTKQLINEKLRTLEAIEQELRESKERSGEFQRWQDQLAKLDQTIALEEAELSNLRERSDWIHKCIQSRDSWVELLEIESELEELPVFNDFPEHVLERFEQAQDHLEHTKVELQGIQRRLVDANEQLNRLSVNEKLVEQKAELEQLLEAAIVYMNSTAKVADHAAEVEGLRDQLHRYLRLISSDWTEHELQRFPLSIHDQEQVKSFAERFNTYAERRQARIHDHERLVEQAEQYRNTKKELLSEQLEIAQRMKGPLPSTLSIEYGRSEAFKAELVKLWEQLKKVTADLIHVEQRLFDAKRSEQLLRPQRGSEPIRAGGAKSNDVWVRLLVIAISIVLPLWVIVGLGSTLTGIVIFVLISLFHVYIWLQKRGKITRPETDNSLHVEASTHLDHMEQETRRIRLLWEAASRQLYDKLSLFSATGDMARMEAATGRSLSDLCENLSVMEAVEQTEPWVQCVIHQLDVFIQADAELQATAIQLEAASQSLAELEARIAVIMDRDSDDQRSEAILKQEWGSWLEQYQLPSELSVDVMSTMFQYAEAALQLLDQINRINQRLAIYTESQHTFERAAAQFLHQHGVTEYLTAAQIMYELRKLKEQLDAQASIQESRRHVKRQISELSNDEHMGMARLANIQDKLNELMHSVHAVDEDKLRKTVRLYERRVELEKSKRHLEVVIFTWVKQEHQQQLFLTLEQYDRAQLDQQLATAKDAMIQIESRLNESKDRRGGLRKEIDHLQSGGQHAELLQRHQEHIAEYQQLASKWAELSLSSELIRRAKEIYERERQPGVLLRASQYMRIITDDRFVRVVSRTGEKRIFVERENGQQIDSTYLSRGTAEQLYLAMRFALADEYSKTVAMPIIMDDIFVNFDADRLARTLQVLSEVAHRHQIIIFTCHEHVANALQSALSHVQLINLELEEAGGC